MTRVAVDLDLLQMAYDKIAADSPYPSALLDRLADALYLQEQKQEPVAYWHRDKGFYWAKPTEIRMDAITDVPPLPLYAALPKPEPVAHVENGVLVRSALPKGYTGPLYAAPPEPPTIARAVEAEREAICPIVYGLCISDNNAQEIVNAIRARKEK
jgi:hypothetical protein